jgi:hypothetical protein
VLATAAFPSTTVAASPVRVGVTFTGSAHERLQDVERWVLLSENECYLRHSRDQEASATWAIAWDSVAGKRAIARAPNASGGVSGDDMRDTCDADEPPPDDPGDDIPDDWIRNVTCSDPLHVNGTAVLDWGRGVLTVSAPKLSLEPDALCTEESRSQDWRATVRIDPAKLRRGRSVSFRVGTRNAHANCKHEAKPYDGYRSFDDCGDTLTWSGLVVVTRL